MAFRQIKSPALADKAVIDTKLDESAVQGQSTLTGMTDPSTCFTLLYDVGSDSLKKIGADAFFASFSTDDLTEGSNLYYTSARANADVAQQIDDDVLVEKNRAIGEEGRIESESKTRDNKLEGQDSALSNRITNEVTRAGNEETRIEDESKQRDSALGIRIDNVLNNTDEVALNSLAEIVTAFQNADSALSGSIIQNAADIVTERGRAVARENQIETEYRLADSALSDRIIERKSATDSDFIHFTLADAGLQSQISTNDTDIATLFAQDSAETQRAGDEESRIEDKIDVEVARSTAVDSAHSAQITAANLARVTDDNVVRSEFAAADQVIKGQVEARDDALIGDLTVDGTSGNTVTDRIATAKQEAINASNDVVAFENDARIAADSDLQEQITAEVTRATATEDALSDRIDSDYTANWADHAAIRSEFAAGDSHLQDQINFITSNTDSAALDSLTEIVAEVARVDGTVNALIQTNVGDIVAERDARIAADSALGIRIDIETSTRRAGDSAANKRIDDAILDYVARDSDVLSSAKAYTDQEADTHQAASEEYTRQYVTPRIGDATVDGTAGNSITNRITTAKSEAITFALGLDSDERARATTAEGLLSGRVGHVEGLLDSETFVTVAQTVVPAINELHGDAVSYDLQSKDRDSALGSRIDLLENGTSIDVDALNTRIGIEEGVRDRADSDLLARLVVEENRSKLEDQQHDSDISALGLTTSGIRGDLTIETTNRINEDTTLRNRIAADSDRLTLLDSEAHVRMDVIFDTSESKDSDLLARLIVEEDRSKAKDSSHDSDISVLYSQVGTDVQDLQDQIDVEEAARIAGDSALQAQITSNDGDITALQVKDSDLQAQISSNDADIFNLQAKDSNQHATAMQAIADEETRATGIENGLRSDVDSAHARIDHILDGSSTDLDQMLEIVEAFRDADSDLDGVITNNTGRITTLEDRADETDSEQGVQDGRLTSLETRMTANEAVDSGQSVTIGDHESRITANETRIGDKALVLKTTSQSLSGAINDLYDDISAEGTSLVGLTDRVEDLEDRADETDTEQGVQDARLDSAEGRLTVNEGDIDGLETFMGTGLLDTSAQAVRPAINELHTQVDNNTSRVGVVETRANETDIEQTAQDLRLDSLESDRAFNIIKDTQQDTRLDGLENRVDMDTVFQTSANKVVPAINELKGRLDVSDQFAQAEKVRQDQDSDRLTTEISTRAQEDSALNASINARIDSSENRIAGDIAVSLAEAKAYTRDYADDAESDARAYALALVSQENEARILNQNSQRQLIDGNHDIGTQRDNAQDLLISGLQTELDATQVGAGLGADGEYLTPDSGATTYLGATTSLMQAIVTLDTNLSTVAGVNNNGRNSLQQQITNEIAARENGDSDLLARLIAEEDYTKAQDSAINGRIDNTNSALAQEVIDRVAGDSALQAQIDFIVSNTDSAAFDSLTEIVAEFQRVDGGLTDLISDNASEIVRVEAESKSRDSDEEAARIGGDANLQTQVDGRVEKAGDTMSGDLDMTGNIVTGLALPVAPSDATSKAYTDARLLEQHISQFTTDSLTEGTRLYFTEARARAAVSVFDVDGEGDVSYDANTGVISIATGKSFLELEDVVETSFSGHEGFVSRVKTDGTGIEFVPPTQLAFNDAKRQTINGDGMASTYSLDFYTAQINALVFVGGVIQDPGVHYTINSGTQEITFTSAVPLGTQAVVIAQSTNSVGVLDPKSVGIETLADNLKAFEHGLDVVAGSSPTVVSSFDPTVYRSAKYVVTVEQDGEFETRECMVVHDGTSAYITEYGIVYTGSSLLGDTDIRFINSNVELMYTAESGNAVVSVAVTYVNV
jgi:hypothetical protein